MTMYVHPMPKAVTKIKSALTNTHQRYATRSFPTLPPFSQDCPHSLCPFFLERQGSRAREPSDLSLTSNVVRVIFRRIDIRQNAGIIKRDFSDASRIFPYYDF